MGPVPARNSSSLGRDQGQVKAGSGHSILPTGVFRVTATGRSPCRISSDRSTAFNGHRLNAVKPVRETGGSPHHDYFTQPLPQSTSRAI